jgi:hypothetical protein
MAALLYTAPLRAEDPQKCFQTRTKRAMLRKYDYKYAGPPGVTSRTSGQEGSSKVSSERMTQHSTMSVDPGVTTGDSQSSTEFSSSYGDCNYYGLNDKQIRREGFIADNLPELKREIARGYGDHLDAFAYLSDCDDAAAGAFAAALKAGYPTLQAIDNIRSSFSIGVDAIVRKDADLSRHCRLGAG